MDFQFSKEELKFRDELRSFLAKELPNNWIGPEPYDDAIWPFALELRRKLGAKGWMTVTWPKQYGGLEGTIGQALIFIEEMSYYRAPGRDAQGVGFLGPCLLVHGTEEQKQEFLRPIARGEVTWAQGFSEPESGSDLASLKTRAVEDGDDFVITGQKIWSSGAHKADWYHLLARTDPEAPKHRGITYFLVDMHTPGVEVRPIVDMSNTKRFNEVFLDKVRVPRKNVIGEVNRGWYTAMSTLDFERTAIEYSAEGRRLIEDVMEFARDVKCNGSALIEEPRVRSLLANAAVENEVARLLSYRVLWMQSQQQIPNHEASMVKAFATETLQKTANSAMKVMGLYGQLDEKSKWASLEGFVKRFYLTTVSRTIAGGTSEIQRNIVAMRGLGLPKGA